MNRDQILAILYEMAIVIGGEMKLRPLLTKTLQRLLFHTSFPCGVVFLDAPELASRQLRKGYVNARVELSIGDFELAEHNGKAVEIPSALLQGEAELKESRDLLNELPLRKNYYSFFLRLPIGESGVILLLSPTMPASDVPFARIFQPVLSNLAKSILLCRSNEAYTQRLIADQRIAETALQDMSYRNRLILDSVGEGICGLDRFGNATFVNPAATKLLGYEPGELTGTPLHEIVHHRRPDGWAVSLEECPISLTISDGKQRRVSEDLFQRKDGTNFLVDYICTPLRDDGKTVGAVVVFQDVTERKKTEEEVRQLASIVESSDDAIIGKTLDGRIATWNKGAERIYGYVAGEIRGRPISNLIPPGFPDDTGKILEKIQRGDHINHYETLRRRKDGKGIYVSLTVSPVKDRNGRITGASAIARDITERKDSEGRAAIISDLLKLYTRSFSLKEYLDAAIELIRSWSGSRHCGIRIVDREGNIPFESCAGYNPEFFKWEGVLSLSRDQCVCTRVIAGKPDSGEYRAMTSNGSFFENNTSAFFAGVAEAASERYRGACMKHGYLSLAVIPIRYRSDTLGAIHLADERRDMVPLKNVEFLEQMALVIGEAMFRFGVEKDLRESNIILKQANAYNRSLIEASLDPLVTIGPGGAITDVNAATETATGRNRNELIGTDFSDYFTEPEKARAGYQLVFREGAVRDYALEIRHLDGAVTPVLYNATLYRDEQGSVIGVFAAARDVTALKTAEKDLTKLNRALLTLSTCNMTLIHAKEERLLLQDICKAIVEVGGYRMVWVGFVERDEKKTIRPVASAGRENGYLAALPLTGDGTCDCPASIAIRSNEPFIVRDVLRGAVDKPWRFEARKRQYDACIALPLRFNNDCIGALNIYTSEQNAFAEDEVRLLKELAGDLSFGIMMLRTKAERDRAVEDRQNYLEKIRKVMEDTIQAIAAILEMRDPYISGHQRRVAQLAVAISGELGLTKQRIEGIHFGSLIHDIGKIYVPAEFLSRPGKLADLEFNLIKTHPQVGYDIVKDIEFPWPVAQMIRQHHEHMNGTGYPQGLLGDDIILEARILVVADVVEAMASHRPYRPARGIDTALAEVLENRGILYDAAVVDACLRLIREKGFVFT